MSTMLDATGPTVPLQREALADAEGERIARGGKATVRIEGTLIGTPELVAIPHLRDTRTEATVRAGEYTFTVVARGGVAEALNAIGDRGEVVVRGHLITHTREVDRQKRVELEIRADEVVHGGA